MKKAFWLAGAAILALTQTAVAGDTIKIGFVSTFSGPTAVIGNDMRNSFELALDHLGGRPPVGGPRLVAWPCARPFGPQDGRQAGRGDL